MNLKAKILFSFLTLIFLTVILGVTSYVNSKNVGEHFAYLIEHDLNVLQNAQKLQKIVVDAETGMRGFVITGKEEFLEPYNAALEDFEALLETEKKLVSDNPSQVQRLDRINELFTEWQTRVASQNIESVKNGNSEVAVNLISSGIGKAILDEIRSEFDEFIKIENELKDKRALEAERLDTITSLTSIVIIVSSITIGITIVMLMSNYVLRRIALLNKAAEMLANQKYKTIDISGNDELTNLAVTFNKMTETIRQSIMLKDAYADRLEKAFAEIKKTEKSKSEFSSMISHELKTPLTPIQGYCDMLKDSKLGELNADQLDAVQHIQKNVDILERLISDVLDVQKLDLKEMKFVRSEFIVKKLLEETIEGLSPLMEEKSIRCSLMVDGKITLSSDRDRIKQIINNLVKNSIDFVPESGGKIEIGTKKEDELVTFYVRDNGRGIPKSEHKNLFKKFYQVDTSFKRKHGGTGLGLVICKAISEGLGGKIWFESEEERETIFYFTIPAVPEKSSSLKTNDKI